MIRVCVQLHVGSGLVSSLIRWQQRGRYAHASLLVDGTLYESVSKGGVRAVGAAAYESSYRDGSIVQAPVYLIDTQVEELKRWLDQQVGKGYDFRSIVRFLTRKAENRGADRRWFCSELVVAALNHVGHYPFHNTAPWEVSPGLLARSPMLHFRGYEP